MHPRGLAEHAPRPLAAPTLQRHGETDYNRSKIIQGHLDTPLNAEGEAQAGVVARYLAQTTSFDAMYSSDLQRARVVSVGARLHYKSAR